MVIDLQEEAAALRGANDVPLISRQDRLVHIARSKIRAASKEQATELSNSEIRKLVGFQSLPSGLRLLRSWAGSGRSDELRKINYLELAVARYLHIRVHGPARTFRHIVVDEAQELTPLDLASISLCAPNGNITLVGDTCQSISLHRSSTRWEPLREVLDAAAVVELSETYRSTKEIGSITSHLRRQIDPAAISQATSSRSGDVPCLHVVNSEHLLQNKTVEEAVRMERSLTGRVAVLVRSDSQRRAISRALKEKGSNAEVSRVDMVRGREFSGVVVYDVSETAYSSSKPISARILYLAATRAIHQLALVSYGDATKLLSDIPPEFLRRQDADMKAGYSLGAER